MYRLMFLFEHVCRLMEKLIIQERKKFYVTHLIINETNKQKKKNVTIRGAKVTGQPLKQGRWKMSKECIEKEC